MKKYIALISTTLLISGCSTNFINTDKNLSLNEKCDMKIEKNSTNTIQRGHFDPNRAMELTTFGVKDKCDKVVYYTTRLLSTNNYYLYSANDDLKTYDKSCDTKDINGVNYSECDSGYYVDYSHKYRFGYKQKDIIYTDTKECFDMIKSCEKFENLTTLDAQKEYDDFENKEIITQRYEKIVEDKNNDKIIP